ncbi:uncharacterized protein [Miscanthus floridulus]|uniref:uncharacterized protein n=1 Tax=Miscanthus floridulus TaxID=154761 RepID=UPI00345A77A2
MAEPTLAEVMEMLKSMNAEMQTLKSDMAAIKYKPGSSTISGGDSRDQDFHPKHKKWDFPRFDGTTDPLLFLNKCEAYFRQHRTMAEERVGHAAYHLVDAAQLLYDQLQEDEGTPTWGRFKDLLNLRFGPPLRSAPLFELTECRRTGTVEEYTNRFQDLLPRAGRLDEAQRVQLFTGGLLPPLSHAVRIHNPATLAAAMSLARQVELMEADRQAPLPPRPPPRITPASPAPRLALPAAQPLLPLPAPPAAGQQGRGESKQGCLTPEEMAERHRKGLCFNCNEKYSRGHNRFCRRLFFLDGVEIDDAPGDGDAVQAATGDPEAPVFSLHAVAGLPVGKTMQVRVSVGATSLIALLDTGSTHSFIGGEAAQRTGLPIQPRPRLTATVANGEKVPCPGVLRSAPLAIDDLSFTVDLFVMPLAGYDIVLGTHWMATLGQLVWDLAAGTVSFQHEGRTVCWAGVPAPGAHGPSTVSASALLLEELLARFEGVFAEPSGLPPVRHREHAITLKPGATPVAVRPYRYPAAHKDELERQCAEMLA